MSANTSLYGGNLFLMSTYGLSDRWRFELPLLLERVDSERSALGGVGLEREWGGAHFQAHLGLVLMSKLSWKPEWDYRAGAYVSAGLRWLFTWGVGASLEVRAAALGPAGKAPDELSLTPVLSLYSEL
jgi:hypothetical protein